MPTGSGSTDGCSPDKPDLRHMHTRVICGVMRVPARSRLEIANEIMVKQFWTLAPAGV